VAEYSIGDFDFIALDGYWRPPAEVVTFDQRGGVDGTELTAHGQKGQPFQLTSHVDQTTYAVALGTINDYQALINQDPVPLVIGGRNSGSVGSNGFKAAVLDVRCRACLAISGAMGGLNPPSLAWLVCSWTLIAIENESS